jgi:hypothetical protein
MVGVREENWEKNLPAAKGTHEKTPSRQEYIPAQYTKKKKKERAFKGK